MQRANGHFAFKIRAGTLKTVLAFSFLRTCSERFESTSGKQMRIPTASFADTPNEVVVIRWQAVWQQLSQAQQGPLKYPVLHSKSLSVVVPCNMPRDHPSYILQRPRRRRPFL